MKMLPQIVSFLAIICKVSSSAAPDNFLLNFDKDLHVFGMRRNITRKVTTVVEKPETRRNRSMKGVFDEDEVDSAEHDVFRPIKSICNVATSLIREEVNPIFGNATHAEVIAATHEGTKKRRWWGIFSRRTENRQGVDTKTKK